MRLLLDVVLWMFALGIAVTLRYDLRLPDGVASGLLRRLPIFAAIQASCGVALGLYRRRWRYGSFDELLGVAASAAIGTVISYSSAGAVDASVTASAFRICASSPACLRLEP